MTTHTRTRIIIAATAAAVVLSLGAVAAWAHQPTSGTVKADPCTVALREADTISVHSRADWIEVQDLVDAGELASTDRAAALAEAVRLDDQISAREDLLEAAQARYVQARDLCLTSLN